jgi:hypothetical protein
MMNIVLAEEAKPVLLPALCSCGGDKGPMFAAAMKIKEGVPQTIEDLLPPGVPLEAYFSIGKLGMEGRKFGGRITPEAVINRYALSGHTKDIEQDGSQVAAEFPQSVQPVVHTLVPVMRVSEKVYRYENGDLAITFRNPVELGSLEGQLVVHLAGVFASGCSKEFLDEILEKQRKPDSRFWELAKGLKEVDFNKDSPVLRRLTVAGKETLGL